MDHEREPPCRQLARSRCVKHGVAQRVSELFRNSSAAARAIDVVRTSRVFIAVAAEHEDGALSSTNRLKPRTLIVLAVGALALLALVLGFLRATDPNPSQKPRGERDDVEARAPTTEGSSADDDSSATALSSNATLQQPGEASDGTPRAADVARAAPARATKIVFRHDSGAPAAGLRLRRADELGTGAVEELEHRAPNWTLHLDDHGELDLAAARTLGSVVAVRLGEHVVELVAFDPEHVREYELATLVDQEFVLQGVPGGRDGTIVISLYSDALWRLPSSSEVTHRANPGPFSDTWTVRAKSVASSLVVARFQLELSRANPKASARLPRGAVHFEKLREPAGWSAVLGHELNIDGRPIAIAVRAVPVVEARLARDDAGALLVPRSVHLRSEVDARDGNAASSGEIALDFEVDADVLIVGLEHRERDETGVRYALVFHWPDGATTSTGPGDWDSLARPFEFGPGRVPHSR